MPGISVRSWRKSASRATAPMPSSVRASCGSITIAMRPPRRRRAARRSCPARPKRANSTSGSPRTTPRSECRPPRPGSRSLRPRSPGSRPGSGRGPSIRGTGPSSRRFGPSSRRSRTPGWCRNPIDRFILARLEAEGLSPSPQADKVTLIRRLSLDLIGLPPSVEDVDAFVADTRDDAYERLVGRLLDSPQYGERWGRIWLDAARYADSDGYEKDKSRQVSAYRDWVIHALNRDLPYNQFIIDQIAGDLLPGASQDEVVATGFLRNSMINEEGGVDPEQFRMEAMFDRMDCIGKGILGLTIQCAQCHTHKYDPLTQEEYYRVFAFLNNSHEANVAVYAPDELMKRAEVLRTSGISRMTSGIATPPGRSTWRPGRSRSPAISLPGRSCGRRSTRNRPGGEKNYLLEDGSYLAQGYAPTKHTVELSVKTDFSPITAFRLELLNDPNLPMGGPGRSIKGTAALTEFRVDAAPADAPAKKTRVKFSRASADINPPEKPLDRIFDDKSGKKRVTGPIGFAIDGKDDTAWATDAGPGRRNQPRKAVFVAEKPIAFPGGTILTFHLVQNHGGWNSDDNQSHNIGRFRLSVTSAPTPSPTRSPERSARSSPSPREADPRPGRGRLQLLADDRARLEGGQCPDRGAMEAASRGLLATGPLGAGSAAADAGTPARRLPQADQAGRRPACPRSSIRCPPDAPPPG